MHRIHPEYAREIHENFTKGNIADGLVKTCDAVQYWSDTLTQEIGLQSMAEMPFIIAAMKNIVAAYDKLAPGVENAADNLMKGMEMNVLAVKIQHGR